VRRYWRGPTWLNAAWLVWIGLRRLGYVEQAEAMVDALAGAALGEGLWEYYNPYDGRGHAARDFAWSSLLVEMAEPDPSAARSYL